MPVGVIANDCPPTVTCKNCLRNRLKVYNLFLRTPPDEEPKKPGAKPVVLVVQIDRADSDCWICGAQTDWSYGVPVCEDIVFPTSYEGEWGGVPACKRCHDAQPRLSKPLRIPDFINFAQQKETPDGTHREP